MIVKKVFATACLLIVFSFGAVSGAYADSAPHCLLVIEGSAFYLEAHRGKLHQLIDLLPADWQVGIVLLGYSKEFASLKPLTQERRWRFHLLLEQAIAESAALDSDGEDTSAQLLALLTEANVRKSLLLFKAPGTTLPGWQGAAERAALQGVCFWEVSLEGTPLTLQGRVQEAVSQGPVRRQFSLPEFLGLPVCPKYSSEEGRTHHLRVPADAQALVLCFPRNSAAYTLVSPSGRSVETFMSAEQVLTGSDYVCLHLAPGLSFLAGEWEGEWRLSFSEGTPLDAWYYGGAALVADWFTEHSLRLLQAVPSAELDPSHKAEQVELLDLQGQFLLSLNDVGLNGDAKAADSIFSALLPAHLRGGPALLLMRAGGVEHLLPIFIPASGSLAPADNESLQLLSPGWACLTTLLIICYSGLLRVFAFGPSKPLWRIRYYGPGDRQEDYWLKKGAVIIGNGEERSLGMPGTESALFRLRRSLNGGLALDVMQAEAPVIVNTERVYFRRELRHGDRVELKKGYLVVEEAARLRVGKFARGGGCEQEKWILG